MKTMLKTMMMVTMAFGGMLVASAFGVVPLASANPGGAEPLGNYTDCQDSCRDCQKACEKIPAGSKNTDCMRSCNATAAGCCSGYGKKPPPGLSCFCQ